MTEKALALMVLSLSSALIHTVSAGGAYCAKAARAQAAALGLNYPGLHGAPDLSGPPPYSAQHPSVLQHQPSQPNLQSPLVNYEPFFFPPRVDPRSRPAAYGGHRLNQFNPLTSFSRGEPWNNQRPDLEPMMRVDPLTETQPSGQDQLVGPWGLDGEKKQFPFVYDGPGVAVDASVLSRNGISKVNGLPLPSIPGYGVYYMVYPAGARPAANGEPRRQTYGRRNGNARHPFYRRKK
ncbi:unnamed protein product [Knipowitschia caucasica]|uniref:Secreted protein n=1 Tax=Knipowitschia caucasica TaxID=637954 RepID=A0AAV2MAB5_KNICA